MKKIFILYSRYFNIVQNCYEIGGIETYIRNLCSVALALNIEPHVIFPVKDRDDNMILPSGEWIHAVDCSAERTEALVEKAYELGDFRNDILIFATSTMIVRTRFKTTIGIQHGIYWDSTLIHGKALSGRLSTTIARALQARQILNTHSIVTNMVCVDLNYVNWMRALSVNNRLPYTYIPNFADTSTAAPERGNNGKVRIVFARRFEAIRGCKMLANVMPRVLSEHPDVELTIAGAGSLEHDLHSVFECEPRVTFARYDARESVAFHGQFDVALVPSIASEGTSLSLLEAMAAGCAVVATDVGGMSNIVLSGHNGLLIQPDGNDFYAAVSAVVDDAELRARLSRNARQTVEDSFSRIRWADSWSGVFMRFI